VLVEHVCHFHLCSGIDATQPAPFPFLLALSLSLSFSLSLSLLTLSISLTHTQWRAHCAYGGDNYAPAESLTNLLVKHYRENIEDAEVRTNWPAARVVVRSAVASEPSIVPDTYSTSADVGDTTERELQPGLLRCVEGALLLPGAPAAVGLVRTMLLGAEWMAELMSAMSRRADAAAEAAQSPQPQEAPECDTPFDLELPAVMVDGPRGESIEADYVVITVPLSILKVSGGMGLMHCQRASFCVLDAHQ
jgi:hypothetical protein